jgi:acetoin utilization deacetylase AcuC-like enzyme
LQPPFEHPGRADAIRATLADDDRFSIVEPDAWGAEVISAVHDPGLVEFLERAWRDYQLRHPGTHDVVPEVFAVPGLVEGIGPFPRRGRIDFELGQWCFETTTPLTEGTFEAARSAVDVGLTATSAVLEGEPTAYGLCRPPGHHAPTALYGGYCFFNNAAIAADAIGRATGERVGILDVDFHHGNGTQQIFWRRGDVRYVSLHGDPDRQYPYYLGRADEIGEGEGRGENLNLPLPADTDDEAYLATLDRALEALVAAPGSVIVVSLGFDTFKQDPLGDFALTVAGYHEPGRRVAATGRRLVILQEGGYHLPTLGENARAWLRGAEGRPID